MTYHNINILYILGNEKLYYNRSHIKIKIFVQNQGGAEF
jgi:hypothetical protein